jgi:hypothetical protein
MLLINIYQKSFMVFFHFRLGVVWWDMPFGLQREAWDHAAPSEAQIVSMLKKISALAQIPEFYFIYVHRHDLAARYIAACEHSGLSTVNPFYWYKPNMNAEHSATIMSVETLGVAKYASDNKSTGYDKWPTHEGFFLNPLNRHNHLRSDQSIQGP